MATDKHIKNFTAADIERYHKGLLSDKERHDLEKAALDDPFLADALEGFAVAGVDVNADIAELKKRLAERTEGAKVVEMGSSRRLMSPMLRVAAMVIIVVGAGLLVYQFAFNKKNNEVAQVKTPAKEEVKKVDSTITPIPSSTTVTTKEIQPAEVKNNPGTTATVTEKRADLVSTVKASGETNRETTTTDKIVADEKPVPVSGAPVTTTPDKAKETNEVVTRSANPKGAEKEGAGREETKKAVVAKKQQTEKDGTKDREDNKLADVVAQNNKADDQYYRNQAMNTFRGRVTDPSNIGLPFANVTNVRDNVGTYTDANGNFTLTSPDSVLNVQIRSLGYDQSNTLLRNTAPTNQVVLQEDRRNLSEVVISSQKPNATARSKDANRKFIEPEPADGWEKYDSYLANNLNTPDDFKQQKTNDNNSVQVSFEVDKNGEPINIRVEKSLCPSCDKEAIRLVKEGPKWKRTANKKGRTTVTINF